MVFRGCMKILQKKVCYSLMRAKTVSLPCCGEVCLMHSVGSDVVFMLDVRSH